MNRRIVLTFLGALVGRSAVATAGTGGTDIGNPRGNTRDQKQVALIVSLTVKSGFEAEFLSLLEPVLDAMRHEATFINAVLHRDPGNPARFMLYETWADQEELTQVQIHRAYRKTYESRLPDVLAEPRQVQIWQAIRSDFTFLAR